MVTLRKTLGLAALLTALGTTSARAQDVPIDPPGDAYHLKLQCDDKAVPLKEEVPGQSYSAIINTGQSCRITTDHLKDKITHEKTEVKRFSTEKPQGEVAPATSYEKSTLRRKGVVETFNDVHLVLKEPGEYQILIPFTTEQGARDRNRLELKVFPQETAAPASASEAKKAEPAKEAPKFFPSLGLDITGKNIKGTFAQDGTSTRLSTIEYTVNAPIHFSPEFTLTPEFAVRTPDVNGTKYTAYSFGGKLDIDTNQFDLMLRYHHDNQSDLVRAFNGMENVDLNHFEGNISLGDNLKFRAGGNITWNGDIAMHNAYVGGSLYPLGGKELEAGANITHTSFINGDRYTAFAPWISWKKDDLPLQLRAGASLGQTNGINGAITFSPLDFFHLDLGGSFMSSSGEKSKLDMSALYGNLTLDFK